MIFDFQADLPNRPLLLEASAGTGKTWVTATLTARFIAEQGVGIGEVLLITFTDRAARELRARVFERLQLSEADLTRLLETGHTPTDPVSALLGRSDVQRRLDRLRRALTEFDLAHVSTIHSFCQSMLKELGVLGDWNGTDAVLANDAELIAQCATDTFLVTYADDPAPPLTPRQALTVARSACSSPLELAPKGSGAAGFGQLVREQFADRKRSLGLISFDDMPARLGRVLASESLGESAKYALRGRFRLVMVDEFQDTDPIQWGIVQRAFWGEDQATVLIGDPKQSIYGFRNADLMSYLDAAGSANVATLNRNHRSDVGVVKGVEELFGNVRLGDLRIQLHPVEALHGNRLTMRGLTQRVLIRRAVEADLASPTQAAIANDVVETIEALLADATVSGRRLDPSDIAVLVRSSATGTNLLSELGSHGIQAVFPGAESVLDSPAAVDWEHLLSALSDARRATITLAACTNLLGFALEELLDANSGRLDEAGSLIRSLRSAFDETGIPGVHAALETRTRLRERVVALPDGLRLLTDLLHVSELLSAVPAHEPDGILSWLRNGRDRAGQPARGTERRLTTDTAAVRIMTMHAAKGLEFPVVLLPEVSNLNTFPGQPFPYVSGNRRLLHVGGKLDRRDEARVAHERESRDEELRLLYVGLTRAKHMAIAWHVDGKHSQTGALTALLARNRNEPTLSDSYRSVPSSNGISPALVAMSSFSGAPAAAVTLAAPTTPALSSGAFTRTIDQTWRRTSYSGLTAGLHGSTSALPDEPETLELPMRDPDPALALPSPMADLAGGTALGTLVHAAFEHLDWSRLDLVDEARRVVGALAPGFAFDDSSTATLAEAISAACTTPLGPLAEGCALADFPLSRRLAELDFDLPLGDRAPAALLGDLASLMAEQLPPTDPLAAYPAHLADSPAAGQTLNGMLTGSIDVVLRTPSGRFLVVDYKTNRFPTGPDETLTVGHYRPAAMSDAMIQAHYPLQALLYSAALHRFLGWRLPGYEPSTHLGGVAYLFLRGMAGPDTPVVGDSPCGVFAWRPPVALVVAASELLGGRK